MLPFVSEEGFERHREYQRKEALMLSVEEKKYPEYKDVGISGLSRLISRKPELARLTELRASMKLHELYFESFGEHESPRSCVAARYFGSLTSMLSELYVLATSLDAGFVGVAVRSDATPFLFAAGFRGLAWERGCRTVNRGSSRRRSVILRHPAEIFSHGDPMLIIDLYEHAYFDGYSFDKERYISSALRWLRADALDKLQTGIEKA